MKRDVPGSMIAAVAIVCMAMLPRTSGGNHHVAQAAQVDAIPAPQAVHVGSKPVELAVDNHTQHLFVVGGGRLDAQGQPLGSGNVSMLDLSTLRLIRSTPIGRNPIAIAVDARTHHVFVLAVGKPGSALREDGPGSVSMFDDRTGRLLGSTIVGYDARYLAIDPPRGRVYVLASQSANVSRAGLPPDRAIVVLDARTVKVITRIHPPSYAVGILISSRTDRLYVRDNGGPSDAGRCPCIQVFDTATDRLRATISIPQPRGGDNVDVADWAVDERRGHVVLFTSSDTTSNQLDLITILNAATGAVIHTRQTGEYPTVDTTIAIDETSGHIVVQTRIPLAANADVAAGGVEFLDLYDERTGRAVIEHLGVGSYGPDSRTGKLTDVCSDLAVIPGRKRAVVATQVTGGDWFQQAIGASQLKVIDTANGHVLQAIPAGHGCPTLAVTASGARLFVANQQDGTISAIDASRL